MPPINQPLLDEIANNLRIRDLWAGNAKQMTLIKALRLNSDAKLRSALKARNLNKYQTDEVVVFIDDENNLNLHRRY